MASLVLTLLISLGCNKNYFC